MSAQRSIHGPWRPSGFGLLGAVAAVAAGMCALPGLAFAAGHPRSHPLVFQTIAAAGEHTDTAVTIVFLGVVALILAGLIVRRGLRRRTAGAPDRPRASRTPRPLVGAVGAVIVGALVVAAVATLRDGADASTVGGPLQEQALATNPYLDPGTPLRAMAPDFTLENQFGRRTSLQSMRGKVVILAFTDSKCTTVCPLTTTAMLDAQAMLGRAGAKVALVGVDANPDATSRQDVVSYSRAHGMLHRWSFLTGGLPLLRRVWKQYAIQAEVERGQIDHTPALFVIAPDGREAKVYMTQQSYAAVGQLGQILAQEAATLLPGRPRVDARLTYAPFPEIKPAQRERLPRAGGGTVTIGAGAPRLSLFFDTWDQATTSIAAHLLTYNRYATAARHDHLPSLTAIDEADVEASPGALRTFLQRLPHPLDYPVAIDGSGRVADGYEVQDSPWLVLTSATGRILWYWDVSTAGWLSRTALESSVRAALARPAWSPSSASSIQRALAGSPPALAALHAQVGQLLSGGSTALLRRVHALRGYPIVVNAWASWCDACQAEFGILAAASSRYGRRVAFLGADANDSDGDARSFLRQHPVEYPSYATSQAGLSPLAVVAGLPTTIFIDPQGKVVNVHIGQYDAEGSLDEDIATYALHG